MFREMRRAKQQLSREETIEILEKGSSGVLALLGDGAYPYAVPISYVYSDGKLFFHSALSGHKVDAVRSCEKASFCVTARDTVLPEKYTTAYQSAIAFGKIRLIEDEAGKRHAAGLLGEKYNPGHESDSKREIDSGLPHMCILELEIEHLTGKEGKELMLARRGGKASAFSAAERLAFYKKKWLREHVALIVLCCLLACAAYAASVLSALPWLPAVTALAGMIVYMLIRNKMMIYAESHTFGDLDK